MVYLTGFFATELLIFGQGTLLWLGLTDGFAELQLANILGECAYAAGFGLFFLGAAGVEGEWGGEK